MRELRTSRAFSNSPDRRRGGRQVGVDPDIAALVYFHASGFQADAAGVGDTSGRDQQIAAFHGLRAERRLHHHSDDVAGTALYFLHVGACDISFFFWMRKKAPIGRLLTRG
ncbi:hypothetical protein AKI39_12455 [Bordetella sp. H567]|nr:hypothetical protein AKI39_12455 [Bordetella sp. H567]